MAEFNLKDFESINLYSNKNLERVVRNVVNKSSNAVLVNMFEDSLILLDHETGQFYMADYEFDPKKLTICIENYDPVELKKETTTFKDEVKEYFEDEEASAGELVSSYKNNVIAQEKFINELISDAMMTKDFSDIVNYGEVAEVKEEVSIADEKWFKEYQKRLETHPLNEVLYFNWKNPVRISLMETETKKIVNTTAVERAHDLWKIDDWKVKFNDAALTFVEDVEEGTEKFKDIFEEYPQVFFLDGGDRKTLFGKTLISDKNLKENMKLILKGISLLFEKFDLKEMRDEYLSEANSGEIDTSNSAPENQFKDAVKKSGGSIEDQGMNTKEPEEKEKSTAKELSPEELQKLADELKSVAGKVTDEKLKEKLDSIVKKLEGGKDSGTAPDVVKEAVAILSL
jgi:hypothetical protein